MVVRSSIVERRPLIFDAMCRETAFSRSSKIKIAGVITLFDTARHGLRAINVGPDQRVPIGALIAVIATRTCWVPGADTVALTEDLV